MNEVLNKQAPITTIKHIEVSGKLALIKNLLDTLHVAGINYCHWKSSEHLDASMTADTDLDILFDHKQKGKLLELLQELGFKKFDSIKQKQYKDIEDFIGLDFGSGKIVHLHAHFRLTMGEAFLKGYQLDLEDKILDSRIYDETFGIYRITPPFELILLYFREALKIRNRDIAKMYLKNKVHYYGNILSEYKWLRQRVTDKELETILRSLFQNYQPIYKLVTGEFNRRELLKLSGLIKKEYKGQRLYSPAHALLLRWYREVSIKMYKKATRMLNQPIVAQRINPRGGLVIAVVGADGSGKSTVIGNLQATFKKKLDVYRIYFGKGDGKMSWSRKLLVRFKKKVAPVKAELPADHNKPKAERKPSEKKKSFKANFYKSVEALIVANEKRSNLKQMQAAKKKGMLVICDRFPQNQIMGYNDGPMLTDLAHSSNPILRTMSRMEARAYEMASQTLPDVVFKLIADAEVVEARKPGLTKLEVLEQKIEGIKRLQFEGSDVVTVDATQPLEKVLYTIKKKIWESYP